MKIYPLGHCGLLIETALTKIIIDPFLISSADDLIRPVKKLDDFPAPDAILLSHFHPDHFSIDTLSAFDRKTPIYFPFGDPRIPEVLKAIGFFSLHPLQPWEETKLGDFSLIGTPSSGFLPEFGYYLRHHGKSLWHVVDTYPDPEILKHARLKLSSPDLGFFAWKGQRESLFSFYGHVALTDPEVLSRTLAWPQGFSETKWIALPPGWQSQFFPGVTGSFLQNLSPIPPQYGPLSWQSIILEEELQINLNEIEQEKKHGEIENFFDPNPFSEEVDSLKDFVNFWLENTFSQSFRLQRNHFSVKSLADQNIDFCLEITFPDGSCRKKTFEFQDQPGQTIWKHRIGASIFKGVLEGKLSGSGAIVGAHMRIEPPAGYAGKFFDPLVHLFYVKNDYEFLLRKARERHSA